MALTETARPAPSRKLNWYLAAGQALLVLTIVCVALKILPFGRAIRLGSKPIPRAVSGDSAKHVRRYVSLVRRWSGIVPWRSACIHEGIALQWLLRKKGLDARLHYGVGLKSSDEMHAHVWVSVAGETVLGAELADRYSCVAEFPEQH